MRVRIGLKDRLHEVAQGTLEEFRIWGNVGQYVCHGMLKTCERTGQVKEHTCGDIPSRSRHPCLLPVERGHMVYDLRLLPRFKSSSRVQVLAQAGEYLVRSPLPVFQTSDRLWLLDPLSELARNTKLCEFRHILLHRSNCYRVVEPM